MVIGRFMHEDDDYLPNASYLSGLDWSVIETDDCRTQPTTTTSDRSVEQREELMMVRNY